MVKQWVRKRAFYSFNQQNAYLMGLFQAAFGYFYHEEFNVTYVDLNEKVFLAT